MISLIYIYNQVGDIAHIPEINPGILPVTLGTYQLLYILHIQYIYDTSSNDGFMACMSVQQDISYKICHLF